MARCRCTETQCVCVITAGDGISITGSGSPSSPWVVSTGGVFAARTADGLTTADVRAVVEESEVIAEVRALVEQSEAFAPVRRVPVAPVTLSAADTVADADHHGRYLRFTGTGQTYTLPSGDSVPVGSDIEGVGLSGAVTIVAGPGVTVNAPNGLTPFGPGELFRIVRIVKVAADEWDVLLSGPPRR